VNQLHYYDLNIIQNVLFNRANAYFQLARYDASLADATSILMNESDVHLPAIILLARIYNATNRFETVVDTLTNYYHYVKENNEAIRLLQRAKRQWLRTNVATIEQILQYLNAKPYISVIEVDDGINVFVNDDGTGNGVYFDWRSWIQVIEVLLHGGEQVRRVDITESLRTDQWTRGGIISDLVQAAIYGDPKQIVSQIFIIVRELNFCTDLGNVLDDDHVRLVSQTFPSGEMDLEYEIRNDQTNATFTAHFGVNRISMVRTSQ